MSSYGSNEPPTDPWTDETVRVPPPVTPGTPAPVPPPAAQPISPAAAAPIPQSVPPAPQPATFQPGQASYPPQPQPVYQAPPQPAYPAQPAYQQAPQPYQPQDYQPGYAQPAYGQAQPYGQQPVYEEQQPQWPQPPKQRSVIVPVLLTLVAVVVLAGIGIGVYLYANRTTTVAEVPPATNDCVKPNGLAAPNAKLTEVTCSTPGSFTVLKSVTKTSDRTVCTGVTGVSEVFTFTADGPPGVDYVLCLKQN